MDYLNLEKLFKPFPSVNRFASKLAPNIPNSILRNPSSCYFASFLIVWQTSFVNKPVSSSDLKKWL